MHPSRLPSVSTKPLLELVRDWTSHAEAATRVDESLIADVWLSAADDLKKLVSDARFNHSRALIAKRSTASIDVENRATARQLKDTAKNYYVQSAHYFDEADQQLAAGDALAARETRRAGEIAHERATRSEKALEILIEHTGLDPESI